jgi:hypothetical protein
LIEQSKTRPFDKLRADSEQCRRIENLKWARLFAIVVALTVCGTGVEAQQTGKIFPLGYPNPSTASGSAALL